jgi:hypothetical protein
MPIRRELTYPKNSPRTDLSDTKANQIHLLQSQLGGKGWPPQAPTGKNATAIKETYPALSSADSGNSFFINPGAKHMSYLDNALDQASKDACESAHKLIRDHIGA